MNTQSDASGRFAILNGIAALILRLALGVPYFLQSQIGLEFGELPGAATVAWGDWTHFVAYTAKVNSFLPSALAPALAIVATAAEALLGITLILGIFRRPVAFASAALFALFAVAMTVSFGVKAPLNFSVFVAPITNHPSLLCPHASRSTPTHRRNCTRYSAYRSDCRFNGRTSHRCRLSTELRKLDPRLIPRGAKALPGGTNLKSCSKKVRARITPNGQGLTIQEAQRRASRRRPDPLSDTGYLPIVSRLIPAVSIWKARVTAFETRDSILRRTVS